MAAASAAGGALQDMARQAGGRAEVAPTAASGMERTVVPASLDGSQAPGSFAAGATGDGTAGVPDASQIPMEDQIAEQVAYWVHQKTQNAELTIDRDGQPVEVSVSLTGNEAHVAFRSDQSQTRDMLDTSVAQLRELLRGEGLELAGVSIGQSGAGAGGDASGRPSGRGEGGARVGRVQAAAGTVQGAADIPRPSARPDRALDVFA
ncbi:flagellar hook-length control protein FliK [Paracidovorax cattleyae]|nr:flagellar hook-length control protein FliK [Paracidovorax cattleyae]